MGSGGKRKAADVENSAEAVQETLQLSREPNKYSRLGHHEMAKPRPKICDSVLEAVGNTPMVRLHNIERAEGLQCEVLAKCEFFNAGGSVKDRIAKRMFEDAEKTGAIKPGDTIIEPTSGNTGIGLALAAAVKGYKMVVTMPEKMSKEKADVLRALGANIVRTPNEAAWDAPDSHIGVAARINAETPNSHILDQYKNVGNPLAHYDGTGEEIVEQTDGTLDVFVAGAGTGGTLTGTATKILEKIPGCKIVGVDPLGSILALPESMNTTKENIQQGMYHVEGIGYDFIPAVCDRTVAHEWYKSNDKDSFYWARRLMREEGLLCGGSSGAAMSIAIQEARKLKRGQRLVVILPDSIRNYMTKHLDDKWMQERGFMSREDAADATAPWACKHVSDLPLVTPVTVEPDVSLGKAVDIMQKLGFDQLPVVDQNGRVVGMATEGNIALSITSGAKTLDDPVGSVLYKDVAHVTPGTTLAELSHKLDRRHFVLVSTSQTRFNKSGDEVHSTVVIGVVTRIDLLQYIQSTIKPDRAVVEVLSHVAPCA